LFYRLTKKEVKYRRYLIKHLLTEYLDKINQSIKNIKKWHSSNLVIKVKSNLNGKKKLRENCKSLNFTK
jgi:hypothetical protein